MTDFLAAAAESRPDAPAADDGVRRWSYRELDRRAAHAARGLRAAGAGPGGVVALLAEPGLDALAVLHGAFRTGALVAPLNPALTPPERTSALDALRPAVIVGAGGRGAAAYVEDSGAPEPDVRPTFVDPTTPVAVLWTSGTAGQPRGVLLTEAGLRASAEASRNRLGLSPGDCWYASLSPAHVGGLALLTRAALIGSGVAIRGRFSADDLDALIESGRVTHASLVPTMLSRLLDVRGDRRSPDTLRCLLVGGARAPRALVDRALAAGLPVALTYGLTEATSQVATATPTEVRADPSSVGRALSGVEVALSGDGEILVRGPTISPGLIDGTILTDEAGFLATGDLGTLDGEGRLRVVGRRSDRIVSGGTTVDAHEVEAALRRHASVADACVVGVPDDTWGERVAAAVVLAPGGPEVEVLGEWLRARLSPAKRPRLLRAVAALPLNANGKVDRAAVRRLWAEE